MNGWPWYRWVRLVGGLFIAVLFALDLLVVTLLFTASSPAGPHASALPPIVRPQPGALKTATPQPSTTPTSTAGATATTPSALLPATTGATPAPPVAGPQPPTRSIQAPVLVLATTTPLPALPAGR